MADIVGFENALGWAHCRLRGGWKTILSYTMIYIVIVGGLILLSVRAAPKLITDILTGWTMALLGLQIAAFLLLGGSGISNAVRKDIDSGLIESHRLMPISGRAAIFGYLTGPTAPALMGVLATFIMGMLTAATAGLSLNNWLVANLILALFAIIVWIVMVLLSLMTKSALGLMIAFCSIAAFSGFMIFEILPGLSLLIGPALGRNIFGILDHGITWGMEYMLSIGMQLLLGCLCYLAATRKYRRPDRPAFGTGLGLALVASWILMSTTGILIWTTIQPQFHGGFPRMTAYQITASTLVSVAVAIIPLVSAIQEYGHWLKSKRLNDPALRRRPPTTPVVVISVATLVIIVLPCLTLRFAQLTVGNLLPVGLAMFSTLLSLRYLLGILLRVTTKIWIMVALWLFIVWAGPMLLDAVRFGLQRNLDAEIITNISACSPIGVLLNATGEYTLNLIPGLMAQLLLAAGMAILYHLTARGKISDRPNIIP